MVQRPAWLTRSAMTMVAALLFVGCNGVAATPTPGATTAPTPAVRTRPPIETHRSAVAMGGFCGRGGG